MEDMAPMAGLPLDAILSFAIACILIELTPGPNMTWLALAAATEGRRYGFAAVTGVAAGLLAIGMAASLGLAAIIQSSDLIYNVLRWSGVAFLLYLAWDGWQTSAVNRNNIGKPGNRYRTFFLRGLITNLLNPKAAVFYVTVLPTFLPAAAPAMAPFYLTFIYVGVATVIHSLIVVFAGLVEPVLNTPRLEALARKVLSALLALVALWFALGTAR